MPAHATCPFCGLLCDDLLVEVATADSGLSEAGEQLRPVRGACERSRIAFSRLGTAAAAAVSARAGGKPASVDAALDAAAALLGKARRPLIGGLGTDVEGMRATLALARRLGAVVDHAASRIKYRNLHVLQEAGWITTTLTEVKNRADLIALIGDGWATRFPRFIERVVAPATDLLGAPLKRRLVLVDEAAVKAAAALPQDCERLALGAPMRALPALLAMLTAQVAGQPVEPQRLAGTATRLFLQCVEWLRAARYGVVVWAAPDLEFAHAELTLQALSRLLRTLNRDGRFAGLPLAGSNGDLSANAVHTWQTGVPFPASHGNGRVDFDPHRYDMQKVLARHEADCLVWISALSADTPPPATDVPVIALARADMQLEREPAVFVPVATPGIDAAGHLLRTDKVVSLRLPQLRLSPLLSTARTLDALRQRLA
jgi:formylmethanofuran dehydrogenase subunit B